MKFNFMPLTAVLIFASLFSITSCTKDETIDDTKIDGTANVSFELEQQWNGAAFQLNTDLTTESSQTVNFTKLKYLVSNFVFIKDDGSEYSVPESYYLVDASKPSSAILSLKNIPAGDYKAVKFIVGVDSARNTSGAQEGALATTNDLFWSWNTGYVFLKAEGSSPQSSMGFTYHVGGFAGANAAQRTININFGSDRLKVRKGGETEVHTSVNIQKLFTNIDVSTTNMVHMPGAAALSLADNYATMFSFEHLHN